MLDDKHTDLLLADRWGNTPLDEAKRVGAQAIISMLEAKMAPEDIQAAQVQSMPFKSVCIGRAYPQLMHADCYP